MVDPPGTVPTSGSRIVSPTDNATYRMTATGTGGDAVAAGGPCSVTNPPPPPPPPAAPKASLEQRLGEVQDILFDYDKSEVREDATRCCSAMPTSSRPSSATSPQAIITIEGNCDERGW